MISPDRRTPLPIEPKLTTAIWGGDALNKVPDRCVIDVDIRYLPGQDPATLLAQIGDLPDSEVLSTFSRPPAAVDRESPFVTALHEAATPHHVEVPMTVGRDGSSDAVSWGSSSNTMI